MLVTKYSKILPESTKKCLVQIGAHAGHEAGILENAGYKAIAWIEADPDVFTQLQSNLKKHNKAEHTAYNALVTADSDKKYQFYRYSNNGASSSIFQPTELFAQAFEGVLLTEESVELTSTSLDDFTRLNSLSPTTLIIDVQGAELEVLKWAKQILSLVDVVEIEISQQAIYEGGSLFSQVDSFLKDAGFKRVTHVPWHGDVLYVQSELATTKFLFDSLPISSKYLFEYYLGYLKRFFPLLLKRPHYAMKKLASRLT